MNSDCTPHGRISVVNKPDAALLVAILSAGFTAGALVWQLVLYRLWGSRLDVRLTPAVLNEHGTILHGPDRGFAVDIPAEMKSAGRGWTVDLAEVTVVNIGRTAVSVTDISLDLDRRWSSVLARGSEASWSPRSRSRWAAPA